MKNKQDIKAGIIFLVSGIILFLVTLNYIVPSINNQMRGF